MRVLGIDPGLRITGYGCVESAHPARGARTTTPAGAARMVEGGVIRLNPKRTVSQRLLELDTDLAEIIQRLSPDIVAVEKLYAHHKHPLTGVIMAHARGVVLLSVQRGGLKLVELAATEVKKSLTGNGHAGKPQMQAAVTSQLALMAVPRPPDVADAIAIALCALRRAT